MPPDLTARVGEPSPVPRMTLDEIDKALAVCGRATKGPWFSKWEEHEGAFRVYVNDSDGGRIKVSRHGDLPTGWMLIPRAEYDRAFKRVLAKLRGA